MYFKSLKNLAVLGLALAAAISLSDDKQDVNVAYSKLRAAMMSKSVSKLHDIEAPGFVNIDLKGKKLSGAAMDESMKQQFQLLKSVKQFDVKVDNLKVVGGKAWAKSSYVFVGTLAGGPSDQKLHTLKISGTTKDVLVKRGKGWQFLSSQDVTQSVMLDGKKMPNDGA
jgi:hypothetical protein